MDQSRRAVEAYWRSRMVDGVTADEDKVAPVYKLEEICELLQTSPAAIVKEVSDYILKRLDHKSPLVKQKALRLIKYAVGKSGNEFRREMQRNSAAMRELTHYKGQLDPLKGDALNKAVRDTAHEAIAAVFSTDESKAVAPVQGLDKRIQGFGNTNFEVPTGDKKSFLSEVVSISSASIMQGLSTIAAAHSSRKNDTGTYKSPALRRSLTTEPDTHNEYVRNENHKESWEASGISRTSAMWGPDSRVSVTTSISNEDASSSSTVIKSREERLLDTIVTSGGVRLQPTRDALQAFLAETAKLDALAMSHAIETKLESHLWQVRMKAICVLESILKKNDDEHFIIIISYFTENKDSIIKCSELPQASLRDKAIKVLTLLDGEQSYSEKAESCDGKTMPAPVYQMPDLIDTGEFDDCRSQDSMEKQGEHTTEKLKPSCSLVDDLFGSDSLADLNPTINGNQDDPFADVSFHASGDKEQSNLFSGLTVDHNKSDTVLNASNTKKPDLFDVFGTNGEQPEDGEGKDKNNVHNLMSGLSLNGLTKVDELRAQGAASGGAFAGLSFSANSSQSSQIPTNGPSKANLDLTSVYSQAPTHFAIPPNMVLNPGFATQPMNYGAMSAFIAQQQYLMQNLGNLNSGFGYMAGNSAGGSNASPLPDIFQLSNNPLQSHPSITKNPKEDTKAFDFITDHLSAARGSKRVT